MMKTNWMIAIAALLIGGAGGFLAGRGGSGSQGEEGDIAVLATKTGRSGVPAAAADAGKRSTRGQTLDEIRREPGQMNRLDALVDYINGLDPSQFAAEAEKLESLPWQERLMSAFLLFTRWGEVDPLAAIDYSNKLGFAGMFTRPAILQSWASVDPENAAKYYQEHARDFMMMGGMGRGMGGGQSGASVIAAEWARDNPDGALAWAQTLEGRDRSEAISAALREIAATDPAAAAAKLAGLSGDDLGRSYSEIAREWGAKNWNEALAWAKSLPAEDQARALSAAIEGLARQDPAKAAQQIASMPPDQVDDNAVEAVAQQMARDNPAEAAKWIAGLKVEDTGGAMREVMMNWATTDAAAALQFVEQQPAGELRDEAVSTYLWSNRGGDPQQSVALAETISDEGSRTRAVVGAAMRWMADDEQAAKAYIQSSTSINDQLKERLLSDDPQRAFGGPGGPGGPGGGGRGGRGGRGR